MEFLQDAKNEFDAAIEYATQEVASIRTGRANPLLVESIGVEAYGTKQPLKNLATITTPDAKTILVDPWDKGVLAEVEKSIVAANTGLNPVNDGNSIRLPIPPLTEETRKELVKTLKQRIEQVKIRIRQHRDDIRSKIAKAQKANEITEDDRFHQQDKLDEMVKEYNGKLDAMSAEKEKEIMTV